MTTLGHGECDIDLGKVSEARDAFDEAFSKISGRSNEFNLITEPVGFEFSDLIGEGIRGAAEENRGAWQGSMNACTLAFGVLEQVHKAVDTYNTKYEEIKERYNTYVRSVGDELPTNYGEMIESYHEEARQAWDELEGKCEDAEDTLKGGATPENIRTLADAGHFGAHGQIGYYINEDVNYFNVDGSDAETIVAALEGAVINGREGSIDALEGHELYLALINNIAVRSGNADRNNEELLDGEIEFLETLHEELGNLEGNYGFLDFVSQVQDSDKISDELRERIQESLGNGTLALSNENVGGGMDYLPQDVQGTANGPETFDGGSAASEYDFWVSEFDALSEILGASNENIKGGTEFSTQLLATSSEVLSLSSYSGPDPSYGTFQNIIDAASRNEESNYIIITGEDFSGKEYEHHENHADVTPESALKNLYGHDWKDDGAAVAGITDWIPENAWKEGEISDHAVDAAMALVEVITSKDMHEELSDVGEYDIDDEDFDPQDVDLYFTAANPELAGSLAGIYETYIDGFAGQQGMDDGGIVLDSKEGGHRNDGGFEATPGDRLVFMEYLVADDDAAGRATFATEAYFDLQLRHFVGEVDTDGEEGEGVSKAGRLQSLLDAAFHNEAEIRKESINDEVDRQERIYSEVAGWGSEGFSQVPWLGTALSRGADWVSEDIINDLYDDFAVRPLSNEDRLGGDGHRSNQEIQNSTHVTVLEYYLGATEGSIPNVGKDEENSGHVESLVEMNVLKEEDGEYSVESDSNKWNVGSSNDRVLANLSHILQNVNPEWIPEENRSGDHGESAHYLSDRSSGIFWEAFSGASEKFKFDSEYNEELYGRKGE